MKRRIFRNIILSVGFAAIIYIALSFYADYSSVIKAFKVFDWKLLPVLISFSFMNYLVRFFKWEYYLHLLGIKIKGRTSFRIFISGMVMTASPAKIGEVLKSYLLKIETGQPISKTAPVVFAERITDFISLVLLALVGGLYYNINIGIIIFFAICFILLLIILSNKGVSDFLIAKLEKVSPISKHTSKLRVIFDSSSLLLKPRPLIYMLALSSVSWLFECFGFYFILINFHLDFSLLWAIFAFSFSTVAGAVSMMPGGLGVVDGSLSFLMISRGTPNEIAVASTFIIRTVTLWFAVLLGALTIIRYKNDLVENITE